MKKIFGIVLLAVSLFSTARAEDLKVYLNNKEMQLDVKPIIINDRTMIPMRAIFEALGAEVSWNEQTNTALGVKNNMHVKATVGSNTVYRNDEAVEFDTAPIIMENRTFVPLRVIAECFDAVVSWDGSSVNIVYAAENEVVSHFLDVGQGDSEFIELPNGDCMLIDASTSAYGGFIADYIKNLGYTDIDYLVATHPHADHIGGMTEIFEDFDIGTVYMPNAVSESKTFERFMDAVENEGCKVVEAKPGVNILSDGKLTIDILAPVSDNYKDLNNYSAVVKLVYGDTSYLYMGDAESESEAEILSADIEADVLKAGHHGSSTSSSPDFIKRVNPKYAVISCGKDNSYGHPHKETISLFDSMGIKTFRTDELGTVVISSDSETISVNKQAESTAGALQSDVRYASSSSDSDTITSAACEEASEEIVYKTKTGKKYHKAGCMYLKSSIEISLSKALEEGLEPCSVCF